MFQFLIGWLQTEAPSINSLRAFMFQFLIGWLQTKLLRQLQLIFVVSFNSS